MDILEPVVEHASPDQRVVLRPVKPSQEVVDEFRYQARRRGEVDELVSRVHADAMVAETASVREDALRHHAVCFQEVPDIPGVETPDRGIAVEGVSDLLDLTAVTRYDLPVHQIPDVFQGQAVVLYGGGGLYGPQPVVIPDLGGYQSF